MLTPARREEQERAEGGPSTSGLGKELWSTGRMDSLLNERSINQNNLATCSGKYLPLEDNTVN